MNSGLVFAAWFLESFVVYTFLRRFDERSTEKLAGRLDLQKHEVNPTITWLSRRIGLKRAFLVTWLSIGFGVAFADATLNLRFPYGVPLFALIIGFSHVFAAANNTHVAYVVDRIGVKEFEREHEERMNELMKMGWKERLGAVFRGNPSAFILSAVAIPLVSFLSYALVATELFTVTVLHAVFLVILFNICFAFVISLILVQSAYVIGPLILAFRYGRSKKSNERSDIQPESNSGVSIELPIVIVKDALNDAQSRGSNTVRISVRLPKFDEVS